MKKFQKDFVNEMKKHLKTATVTVGPYDAPVMHFHNVDPLAIQEIDEHTLSPVEAVDDTIIVVFDGYRMDIPEERMPEFIYRFSVLEHNSLVGLNPSKDTQAQLIKLAMARNYMSYVRDFF